MAYCASVPPMFNEVSYVRLWSTATFVWATHPIHSWDRRIRDGRVTGAVQLAVPTIVEADHGMAFYYWLVDQKRGDSLLNNVYIYIYVYMYIIVCVYIYIYDGWWYMQFFPGLH